MKKITLSLLVFLLLAWSVDAKIRNQNEARELAGTFFENNSSTLMKAPATGSRVTLNYICLNDEEKSASFNQPLYYVYNIGENAGFVIVSADDRANTILGYSDAGSFDINKIPENFRTWLSFYTKELKYLIEKPESSQTINSEILLLNENQNKAPKSTNAGVAPLLGGIKWNQDSPFNDMCPVINIPTAGARAVTGCVATAMAQIMKYHEWPLTGTGSNSYTTATLGIPLSVNFSSTTYDWANMTDTYGISSSQPEKDAVATLMYHCGVATNMDYHTESGTSVNAAANAFKTFFGYDSNLQLYSRDYYTRAEWIDMLKSEIDASRPVLYAGSSSSGGHAFVCDGYDSENYFHFNWGWGGLSNGFFAITALNPGDIGIGGGNGSGYNSFQSIITGIQEPSVSSVESFVLSIAKPLESSVSSTTRNGNFNITLNELFNLGANSFTGSIGLALYNTSGLVEIIDQGTVTDLGSYYGWNSLSFEDLTIPLSVTNGIYKLYAVYKGATETDWQKMRGLVGTPNYLTTTISSTEVQFAEDNTAYPNLTLNSLTVTGNLYQDKTGRFNVNITNSGGEYYSNLIVYLRSTADVNNYQTVVINPTNIATGETYVKQFSGKVNVTPGEYYCVIFADPDNDASTNSYSALEPYIIVNILATPTGSPSLSMPTVMSFPNNASVPKNNAVLTASISNSGDYFENKMIAFIFPSGGGSSLGYIGYQNVIVDAGETTQVTFSGSIDLPVGNYKIAAYYHNGSSWTPITPTSNSVINFTLASEVWTANDVLQNQFNTLYPNPALDKLYVNVSDKTQIIKVLDLAGRQLISEKNIHNGLAEINISTLESGVYILQIIDNENNLNNLKFIKK